MVDGISETAFGGDVAMGADCVGVAPLDSLALILLFGLVRVALGPRRVAEPSPPKSPRPLKPKSGADCPLCQAEQGGEVVDEGTPRVQPRPRRVGAQTLAISRVAEAHVLRGIYP